MPLMIKESGGQSQFTPVPSGTHAAVCTIIADIGYQPGFENGPPQRKVYVAFEIPTERVEWKDKEGVAHEGPSRIGSLYTLSLNEKAKLRAHLESWRGRKFTDAELGGFDLFSIIGKPCMLGVTHNTGKDGNTYANITSVMGLMKGMPAPVAEGAILAYDGAATVEMNAVFEKLPAWIQKKILAQIDMSKQRETVKDSVETAATEPDFDGYLPF